MAFGAKIKLAVDESGKSAFQKQIQSYVNAATANTPIKINNVQLDSNQKAVHATLKKLQEDINASGGVVVKIKAFDQTQALNKLKTDLQSMLNGMNIAGLKDFLNTKNIDETKQKLEDTTAAMQVLRQVTKNVNTAFNSALSGKGKNRLTDTSQIEEIRDAVQRYLKTADELESNVEKRTEAAIVAHQREGIEVVNKIRLYQEQQAAAEAAAKASVSALNTDFADVSKNYEKLINSVSSDKDKYGANYTAPALDEVEAKYNALKETMKEVEQQGNSLSENRKTQIAQEINSLQELIAVTNEVREANVASAQEQAKIATNTAKAQKQAVSLEKSIRSYIAANPKAYAAYTKQFDEMLSSLQASGKMMPEEIDKIRTSFSQLQIAAKETGNTGNTFFSMMESGIKRFSGWTMVTRTVMALIRTFKQMVTAVKEVDAALTELRKVTDLSEQSYKSYLNTASQMAQRVGATLADTVNATADFARLGYSLSDSASLAEAALVYKNVGDGIKDIGEASESIISTIKAFEQFGVTASKSMEIVDKFNEVGNNFAISSVGIGTALQKSASALAAANNSLEESIALATGMNTVLQNPEQVGTALKTLSMYLRAAKTEAEEAGESTEGMAVSVSKLRSELLLLTKGKVDVLIDENTFKSTYQIIKELSEVWNELEDIDTARILELIAGKRNAAAVTSLITNFEDAEKALLTAQNAAGSALTENEKYLDSIAGKTDILKAKFETLANNLINSDIVKFVYDIAAGLIDVVNALSETGQQLTVILGIFTAISMKRTASQLGSIATQVIGSVDDIVATKAASQALIQQIAGLSAAKKTALTTTIMESAAYKGLNAEEQSLLLTNLGLKGSIDGIDVSAKKASVSLKALFVANWPMLILTAITAVVGGAFAIKRAMDEARQASIDAAHAIADSWNEAQSSYTQNIKTLGDMKEEFDKLSEGVDKDGENISLTSDQYDRYQSLISQIIDISPQLVKSYNDQAKAVLNYKTALQDAIDEQEQYKEIAFQTYLSGGKELFEGYNKQYSDIQNAIQKIGFDNDWLGSFTAVFKNGTDSLYDKIFGKWWSFDDHNKNLSEFIKALESTGTVTKSNFYKGKIPSASPNTRFMFGQQQIVTDANMSYLQDVLSDSQSIIKIYENFDKIKTELKKSATFDSVQIDEIQTTLYKVAEQYQKTAELRTSAAEYIEAWLSSGNDEGITKLYESIPMTALDEFKEGLQDVIALNKTGAENKTLARQYTDDVTKLLNAKPIIRLRKMADELENGTIGIDEYLQVVNKYNDGKWFSNYVSEPARKMVFDWLLSFTNGLKQTSGETDKFRKGLLDLKDVIGGLQSSYKILETAQEEMKEGGLSADTIKSIMDSMGEGENLLDFLRVENGLIKLNTEAWEERAAQAINSDIEQIQKEIESLEEENSKLRKESYSSAADVDKAKQQIAANEALIAQDENLIELYGYIYNEITRATDAAQKFVNAIDYSEMTSGLNGIGSSISGITSAMETLNEGTALTKGEIAKLALEYPKLLEAANLFTDGSVEGQRQMLDNMLAMYDEEYDATIDLEINKLEAINDALKARIEAENDKARILDEIAAEQAGNTLQVRGWLTEKLNDFNAIENENYVKMVGGELTITEQTMADILEAQGNTVEDSEAIWQNQAATIAGAFEEGGEGAIKALNQTGEKIEKFATNATNAVKPLGNAIAAALSGDISKLSDNADTGKYKIIDTNIVSGVESSGKSLKDIIKDNNARRAAEEAARAAAEAAAEDAAADKATGILIEGLSVDEWIEKQRQLIKQRTDALNAQITANQNAIDNLKKLKDIDLSSIYSTKSGKESSKKDKESDVELYIADIDAYRDAVRRLEQVQIERATVERKLSNESDLQEQIALERQLMQIYKEEIDAEADLMSQRQDTIKANAAALEELGFSVQYVAESNDFYITNREHLNDLVADSAGGYETITEATSEMRKSAEELINTTESLNESNKESAESILDLGESIVTSQNNIFEHINEMAEQAKTALSEITGAYSTLSEAAKEYSDTGILSVDTFQSLLDLSPAYLTYLRDEEGNISLNKEAMEELIAAKVENLALTKAMTLVDKIHEYRDNEAALRDLAGATRDTTTATWDLVYANLAAENLDSDLTAAFREQIDALRKFGEAAKEGVGQTVEDVAKTTEEILEAINEKATEAKQALGDIAGAYRTLIDAVESYNENGYLSLDTFQSLMDLSPAYIAYLYNEAGAISLNRGALEELIAAKVENLALSKAMALVDSVIAYQNDAAMLYSLATATNVATDATWDFVYAKLAEANLSDDLNAAFTTQIDAIRNLAETAKAGISQSFTTVTKETKSATAATSALNDSINKANKDAEDAYKAQIEAQKEQIKKQKEILENEAKKKIDALKDQIDQFKKIIDLKKQSLAASRKESDYEDDISDRIKEIADLQARIDQLSLDDSRSAQAQRQALIDELNEKQKDLADTQSEHAYDAQVDALDKLADEYEDEKNEEIKKLEANLEKQKAAYDRALDNLENKTYNVYNNITDMSASAGYSINSNLTNNWYKATMAVQEYGNAVAAVSGQKISVNEPLYNRLDAAEYYRSLGGTASMAQFNAAFNAAAGAGQGITRSQVNSIASSLSGANINAPSNVVYEPSISVSINTNGNLNSSSATSFGEQVAEVAIKQLYDTLERKGATSNVSTLKALGSYI